MIITVERLKGCAAYLQLGQGLSAVAILSVFLLYALVNGVVAFAEIELRNSDQINIGVMALAIADPEIFSRDYLFSDRSAFQFYTPFFISLANFLTAITGSYKNGLALLVPALILIYMLGMYRLVYSITEHRPVALFIAIISSPQQWSLGATFWGVADLSAIMPRTFFCTLAPWLVIAVFKLAQQPLKSAPGFWFGLAIGASANLHPVSAFHFSQLILLLLLFSGAKVPLLGLAATMGGMALGAAPVTLNFISGTAGGDAVPFEPFAEVIRQRFATIFPFPPFNVFGITVDATMQYSTAWIYLVAISVWLLLMYRVRAISQSYERWLPRLFLLLLIIQVPIAYLLMNAHRIPLLIAAVAGGVAIIRSGGPNRKDWLILGLLVLTVLLAYILPYFLAEIWFRLQLIGLTTLVAEQSRVSQFIYLPLYLLSARLIQIAALQHEAFRRWTICTLAILLVLYPVRRDVIPLIKTLPEAELLRIKDDHELYSWAKTTTPLDSLFYHDSLAFRFHAQRSITHCWKDLGIAYYSRSRLHEFQQKFNEFQAAYATPESLIGKMQEAKADYVVLSVKHKYELPLPLRFRNSSYVVYGLR